MGVRKIPTSKVALTGVVGGALSQRLHQYESSLERDLIISLEFDRNVESYEEQPIRINYLVDGQPRSYTPDFFVRYRDDIEPANKFKPTIIEVKYRSEIKEKWAELKPKFMAALRYADKRGYCFKIMTEAEIRNEFLENARFLIGYVRANVSYDHVMLLRKKLADLGETTPHELLLSAAVSEEKRLILMHTMWYMVANRIIICDLNRKLKMDSPIWGESSM